MQEKKILVGFGTLDQEAFDKSYGLLFSQLKDMDIDIALLNRKSSAISGFPLLEEVLFGVSEDTVLRIFPLMLNEGRETKEIERLTEKYENTRIHPVMLISQKREIITYLKRTCSDKDKTYVLLGHGSIYSDNQLYYSLMNELPENVILYLHHQETIVKEKDIVTVPLMLTSGRHIQHMNEELRQDRNVSALEKGLLEDVLFRNQLIASVKEFME